MLHNFECFFVCCFFTLNKMVSNSLDSDKVILRSISENYFSYFSTKTYVVGTQKNPLNETVLLSTKITC